MQKKTATKTLITILLLVIIFTGCFILSNLINRIPDNPPGTVGNTAGNLYNNGYFCEDEDVVYFSNPYDSGSLYSMNPDESNIKKILTANVSSINAAGKYIYYYDSGADGADGLGYILGSSGFFRLGKSKIAKPICFHKTSGDTMVLIDNALYYQTYDVENSVSLYKAQTDGTNQVKLSDAQINPANASNGYFDYNNTTTNYHLYRWNTLSDTSTDLFATDVYQPITDDDIVYFINIHDGYKLCRYHMNDGTVETLSEDRVDLFNYYQGLIYYQTSGDEVALKCMNADGSNQVTISDGAYCDINITSRYVYFHELRSDVPVYKVPLGATTITTFRAAEEAALKQTD